MGTDIWINVEVFGLPETFKRKKLPDVHLIDSDGGWNYWERREMWSYSGTGRYGDVEILEAWAVKITGKRDGVTVTLSQEWDDDGGGETLDTYVNGELVREDSQVRAMVPLDYMEYIEDIKRGITAMEASFAQPAGTGRAWEDLKAAMLRLTKGIE